MQIKRICIKCGEVVIIKCNSRGHLKWNELTPDEREILMSGICGPCCNKLYPDEEE